MKDPEDKEFITHAQIEDIKSDPSVGAVLCGFDINISTPSHPSLE